VTHLRESLYRKKEGENFEFFEVSYFDAATIVDDQTNRLVNDKIAQLKKMFE
jgi:hypothetical protein